MLKESKAADSGIKLEVNGKILDSCTTLMKAIRILVQKSKTLQAEIVASGNPVGVEFQLFFATLDPKTDDNNFDFEARNWFLNDTEGGGRCLGC